MGGHGVRVVVRLRPPRQEADAAAADSSKTITMTDDRTTVLRLPRHPDKVVSYKFDKVFGPTAQQSDVFDQVAGFVKHAATGQNATIFAYGPTGSGKTHTMQGTHSDRGVIPRAVDALLSHVEKERTEGAWVDHKVTVSYFELYKEKIWDLVEPKKADLPIRQTANRAIVIPNLAEIEIATVEHFDAVFASALDKRRVASTNLNAHSSRSHAVLLVKLTKTSAKNERVKVTSKLHMIDLAGSEDNRKTGNRGNADRLQESGAINSSLFVLNKVVDAINSKHHRVPYRDSKLTRLLQDSLGGTSYSCMIVNVDPVPEQLQEMHNCLQFASKSRDVVNRPISQIEVEEAPCSKPRPEHSSRKSAKPPTERRSAAVKSAATRPATAIQNQRKPVGTTASKQQHAPRAGARVRQNPTTQSGVNVDVKVLSQIGEKLDMLSSTMAGPDADTEARLARLEAHILAGAVAAAAPQTSEPPQPVHLSPRSKLQVAKAKILEAKAYEKVDVQMAIACYREAEALLPASAQLKVRAKIDELSNSVNSSAIEEDAALSPSPVCERRTPLRSISNSENRRKESKATSTKRAIRQISNSDDSDMEWTPSSEDLAQREPTQSVCKKLRTNNASHWQPSGVVASALSTSARTDNVHLVDEARALLITALNTATEKQLMQLKGVGKKRAQSIVQFRADQRSFSDLNDLRQCGFGDKLLQSFVESNATKVV